MVCTENFEDYGLRAERFCVDFSNVREFGWKFI